MGKIINKRVDKTTLIQIAEYWRTIQPYSELDLNFNWDDNEFVCWNCGDDKSRKRDANKPNPKARLERCHIIPHALGGKDEPSNYVLLCAECHIAAPDHTNPKYMWEWILSNKMELGFYNMYKFNKAEKLFTERKGYSFIKNVLPKLENKYGYDGSMEILTNELKNINLHGIKYSIETYYALFSEIEDKYITNKLGISK
jgi:hypothetical protein